MKKPNVVVSVTYGAFTARRELTISDADREVLDSMPGGAMARLLEAAIGAVAFALGLMVGVRAWLRRAAA